MIALTQQEDEQQLDALLQRALRSLLSGTDHAVYINKNFTRDQAPRLLFKTPEFVEPDEADIAAWLESGWERKIRVRADVKREFSKFPIYHLGKVKGVVAVWADSNWALEQHSVVINLLNIYANQLYLLYKSRLDPLTGLLNRQTFDMKVMDILLGEGFHLDRPKKPDSLTWYLSMVDVDHFKRINDTYGHVIGDEVIILVARLLQTYMRQEDYVFRYGGEEFALVFQSRDDAEAANTLERLRKSIADYMFPQVGRLSVSLGCIALSDFDMVPELVHKADLALYEAKKRGRNQVVFYDALPQQAQPKGAGDAELF